MTASNETPVERPPLPPSPCVGICALKGEYCYGCGRTSDEIAVWGDLSPADQSTVWAELPGRLAGFGFKSFRLAAGPAVVSNFLGRTFRETTGRWRLVSTSVEGSMAIAAGARPVIDETDRKVRATLTSGEKLTLIKHNRVRVFGFSSREDKPQLDTIALVLPKGRAQRDLKDGDGATPEQGMRLAIPEQFAVAWMLRSGIDSATASNLSRIDVREASAQFGSDAGVRLRLRNALGTIETANPTFAAIDADPSANAPADIKISKAFVACAIFHADDPEWLAAALAP